MIKKAGLFVLVLFTLVSCKTVKGIKGSATADPSLALKTILASHADATPDFNTLAARMYVSYEDEKTSQGIGVSLRLEKDKQIWLKASVLGVTLAKVYITQDRVQYYETLNNSYFDGDFTLLSDMLGTKIDFDKAQSILLGQALIDLKPASANMTVINNTYKIQPKNSMDGFLYTLFLKPDTFKVNEQYIEQPLENRNLQLRYGPYQAVGKDAYPTTIYLKATENDKKTTIDIEYRKIDVNANVGFPFNIPAGYNPISL